MRLPISPSLGILYHFRDIAGFCAHDLHQILGAFPSVQIAHVGVSPSRNLKLISREIIFEVFRVCEKHT